MNGGMAIGASAIEILDGAERLRLRRVAAAVMAGVANTRHAGLEQLWIAGAMRFMAVGAILHDRRMFPDEGAAPLGMAAQAVFIRGALDKLLGIGRAVRIVAAGAGDFPFAIGHVRRALQLGAAHLVALQAELRLRLLHAAVLGEWRVIAAIGREGYVDLLFYLVAINAGHAAGFVRTALPKEVSAARMAIHANGILLGNGVCGILAETDGDGVLPASRFHVGPARAVA